MPESTLYVEIKKSSVLLILMSILHLLAFFAALMNALPTQLQLVLCGLIALHFYQQISRYHIHYQPAVLVYTDSAGWQHLVKGIPIPIHILASSVITPFLVIIHYQQHPSLSTNTLLCFNDSLTPSAFRQLVVQLKITYTKKPATH